MWYDETNTETEKSIAFPRNTNLNKAKKNRQLSQLFAYGSDQRKQSDGMCKPLNSLVLNHSQHKPGDTCSTS